MYSYIVSQEAELRLLLGSNEVEEVVSSEDEREALGFAKGSKRSGKQKAKKARRAAEAEAEDETAPAAPGFGVGASVTDGGRARFELNPHDARFAAVFNDARFHIDPSSHEFAARDTPGTTFVLFGSHQFSFVAYTYRTSCTPYDKYSFYEYKN